MNKQKKETYLNMLYILPPPSAPSPPSVWDLIINFHRKGNEANAGPSHSKFDGEPIKKSRRSWHKSSSSSSVPNQSSCHDSGGRDDDNQRTSKSLNESYFACKGTALMLGSTELLQRPIEGRRISQISNELSASQTSIGSVSSDIQQHLQSMFYLLRPEETLKMAVKLESLRAGRTRYLVVVSRPAARQAQSVTTVTTTSQTSTTSQSRHHLSPHADVTSSLSSHHHRCQSTGSISLNPTSYFHDTSISYSSRSNANMTKCDNKTLDEMMIQSCPVSGASDDDQLQFCDTESNVGSSCSSKSSSNEIEESCLLGIDCNDKTTVGLVLRVLADTAIRLDGDGGFSVSVCGSQHIFKPVSVQAMWSALQTLYKISSKAHEHNFFAGGPSHEWVQYYEDRIESDRSCLNEWHAMDSLESRRPPSPDTIRNKPTERDETERVIRTALKEIMMSVDLDEVTSKYIRGRLEEHLDMDLGEFKSFIDEEMLVILGQMDAPTEIFDHVYLGSEWNASNLEELQRNGVGYILNVTREIDNFFPGMFDYCNVRVYDDEKTNLLRHWDNTFRYISRAKMEGSKVLVHCKMGISRSASVVIAYAMKAYNMEFDQAIRHVREKRNCIKPNKNFLTQLETYQGMLDAMKNKEKLQRSKSETNLKSEHSKDGKSLPGSVATPLMQNQERTTSTYPSSKKESSQRNQRPSSSPDISKSECEIVSEEIKPSSQSLETLPKVDTSQEQDDDSACHSTNLRWPCKNGQNYSISQNQIIYLENESANNSMTMGHAEHVEMIAANVPLAQTLIDELKQSQEEMKLRDAQWDPGETRSTTLQQQRVYNCSAEIIHQDSFKTTIAVRKDPDAFSKQVDRVFDREEKRQNRVILGPMRSSSDGADLFVSRQSSWSSVDSACVISNLPSRNSSWGSGDNRAAPSRNSSWGSADVKVIPPTVTEDVVMGQSGIFPYEKDEIPWHPGTVKRTKQKIEEKVVPIMRSASGPSPPTSNTSSSLDAKNNNININKNLCDINKRALLIDNQSNRTIATPSPSSSISRFAKFHPQSVTQSRSKSEEVLSHGRSISNFASQDIMRLSASAPEDSCLKFLRDNGTATSFAMLKLRQRPDYKKSMSDEPMLDKKGNKRENQQILGKVKNLKKSFEAKAVPSLLQPGQTVVNAKKTCQSMPSSPAGTIKEDVSDSNNSSEDISGVRGLVDLYEVAKVPIAIRSQQSPSNLRQRPKSMYESKNHHALKTNIQCKNQQPVPFLISHQKIFQKSDDIRRPPIPLNQQQPIVKNALMSNSQNVVMGQKTLTMGRKIQQHGKTHPLAKLGINKQRLNTSPATAYNTM